MLNSIGEDQNMVNWTTKYVRHGQIFVGLCEVLD